MLKNDRFIDSLKDYDEVCWQNPDYLPNPQTPFDLSDIQDAADRLERFAPYIMKAFPETTNSHGIIESELKAIPQMLSALRQKEHLDTAAKLYLKCDNALPISGSIKARGGIYEVLKFAETVVVPSSSLISSKSVAWTSTLARPISKVSSKMAASSSEAIVSFSGFGATAASTCTFDTPTSMGTPLQCNYNHVSIHALCIRDLTYLILNHIKGYLNSHNTLGKQ